LWAELFWLLSFRDGGRRIAGRHEVASLLYAWETCMKAVHHRFAVLDAWRGVAACLVTVFHFSLWQGFHSHFDHSVIVQQAWLMVDFFFVLSGFVITHAAFGKIRDAKTAISFMIRRFGRLWPLHVAILAVFVGIALGKPLAHGMPPAFDAFYVRAFVYYLLMIQSISIPIAQLWNTPAWSIGIEFYTYFVFTGVCLLAVRFRLSTIGPSLILIALSFVVLRPIGQVGSLSIFRCIYGFFIGHLTYLFWCRRKCHIAAMEWLAVALALAIILIAGGGMLTFFAPFIFAFLIWVFSAESGLISRLGKSSALQNLGAWSYSIYMTHYLAIHAFMGLRTWIDGHFGTHSAFETLWAGDAMTLLFLAFVILVSSVTYRTIEIPAKRFFYALAAGDRAVSEGSAT
jgi:peptidoglycan/LPS O-acetylase OafA/YrhL